LDRVVADLPGAGGLRPGGSFRSRRVNTMRVAAPVLAAATASAATDRHGRRAAVADGYRQEKGPLSTLVDKVDEESFPIGPR
jgi:hypothetical protein